MHFHLLAVGERMPKWVQEAWHDYAKRFPSDARLQLIEIPSFKQAKNTSVERKLNDEGMRLLQAIPKQSHIIALDVKGESWDTPTLAKHIQRWQQLSSHISFLVGGADGLSQECLTRANQRWSLSPLTFPHPLARIIVAEQLYRALSIIQNHPYHRE